MNSSLLLFPLLRYFALFVVLVCKLPHLISIILIVGNSIIKIKGLEKELEEPNNINIILNKIEKEETISEKELKEYALQAREIYNDLNLARCVRCGKHFSPDSIREHVKNCTKRRKKSDIEELNEYFDKEKRDKVIKRNRKSSMEHLKNIANEEIKYFHSLNVKIVQYRPKRSSKQIMENN